MKRKENSQGMGPKNHRDRDPTTRGDSFKIEQPRATTAEQEPDNVLIQTLVTKQARESTFHARSGEVLRRCRRARGEEEGHDVERVIGVRRFVNKNDGE